MKCQICKHGSTYKGYASITLEREGATRFFKKVRQIFTITAAKSITTRRLAVHCLSKQSKRQPGC